jgi:hypothetical protein
MGEATRASQPSVFRAPRLRAPAVQPGLLGLAKSPTVALAAPGAGRGSLTVMTSPAQATHAAGLLLRHAMRSQHVSGCVGGGRGVSPLGGAEGASSLLRAPLAVCRALRLQRAGAPRCRLPSRGAAGRGHARERDPAWTPGIMLSPWPAVPAAAASSTRAKRMTTVLVLRDNVRGHAGRQGGIAVGPEAGQAAAMRTQKAGSRAGSELRGPPDRGPRTNGPNPAILPSPPSVSHSTPDPPPAGLTSWPWRTWPSRGRPAFGGGGSGPGVEAEFGPR